MDASSPPDYAGAWHCTAVEPARAAEGAARHRYQKPARAELIHSCTRFVTGCFPSSNWGPMGRMSRVTVNNT